MSLTVQSTRPSAGGAGFEPATGETMRLTTVRSRRRAHRCDANTTAETDEQMDKDRPTPADSFQHQPAMLDEVIEALSDVPAGPILDATLGGAGHAAALLEALPDCTLIGLDRDTDAIAAASRRLSMFGDRVALQHSDFGDLSLALDRADTRQISAFLFDLGVSSPQLDRVERGFSYRDAGPLDMRMDRTRERTASEVVNGYSESTLADLIYRNSDERYARRIAEAIVAARPVVDTAELAELVRSAIPAPARRTGGHPAKRTFLAIRIEVNSELEQLAVGLDAAIQRLRPGGRGVVISYHSGEDRLVKVRFDRAVTGGCKCPPKLPCGCGARPEAVTLRRRALRPGAAEIERNPRAASARLRILERA